MRLFIAVPIPPEIQASLVQFITKGHKLNSIRWLDPTTLHFTLKFLGDVDDQKVAPLKNELIQVGQSTRPFSLQLSEGGVFPSKRKPQVFWMGLRGGTEDLKALAKNVENTLEPMGFESEKRGFKPHLTVGRSRLIAKGDRGLTVTIQFCTLFSHFQTPEFVVSQFHLYRSHLDAAGVRYEILESFPLRAS